MLGPMQWRVPTILMAGLLAACVSDPPAELRDRPNILLVVADDLGYSDLSPFGSEIQTPALAARAADGITADTLRDSVSEAYEEFRSELLADETAAPEIVPPFTTSIPSFCH